MSDEIERRTFGKRLFGALAAIVAAPFVKLKTITPKPTAEERWKAMLSGTVTFNDSNACYVGECVYSHTDKTGCPHFRFEWKKT